MSGMKQVYREYLLRSSGAHLWNSVCGGSCTHPDFPQKGMTTLSECRQEQKIWELGAWLLVSWWYTNLCFVTDEKLSPTSESWRGGMRKWVCV